MVTLTSIQELDDTTVFTDGLLEYIGLSADQFYLSRVETWSLSADATTDQWAAFNQHAALYDAPQVSHGPRGFQLHYAEGSDHPSAWDESQLTLAGDTYTHGGRDTHVSYTYCGKVPVIHYTWH